MALLYGEASAREKLCSKTEAVAQCLTEMRRDGSGRGSGHNGGQS